MKHLIHIGFPKAASTFLQEWFSRHPQLYFNPGALAGFHDIYQVCRFAATDEQLKYKYFVTSCENIVFPSLSAGLNSVEYGKGVENLVTSYADSQSRVCRTLKDIYPGSRILLITRGFRGFIISGYSQYLRVGGNLSFSGLLQSSDQATKEQMAVDYNYIYKLYADAFGEENLIVLPYEMLRDDKGKFLRSIENALGIDYFEESIGRINESLSAEEIYWYPKISHRVAKFSSKLGSTNFTRIYSRYTRRLFNGKFKKLAQILSYRRNIEKINESDIPLDFIRQQKGKATVFLNNQIYAPYLSEYFLDD